MKKFTKLFLSCALVSVVAAASASIAMAADGDVALTGELTHSVYNPTSNTITIASDDVPEIVAGSQATYLVVEGTDKVEANIEGIDQATGVAFDKTGLTSNPTADDKTEYTVYVGYYKGTEQENTFTIVKGKLYPQAGEGTERLIGDVNFNGKIDTNDAGFVARKAVGGTTKINKAGDAYEFTVAYDTKSVGDEYLIGDVNLNGKVDTNDAGFIARKAVGGTTKINKAGESITIAEKAAATE